MPFVIKKARAVHVASPVPVAELNPPPRARLNAGPASTPPSPPDEVRLDAEPAPESYEVGYGKPPKQTQFQKGQSGNPKGRPKGAKGLNTLIRTLLTEKVAVKTSAGLKRITRIEAMLHKISERAFAGDLRALQALMQHYRASVPDDAARTSTAASVEDMDAHDRAIIDAFTATIREGDAR